MISNYKNWQDIYTIKIVAWCRTSNRPLSELMLAKLTEENIINRPCWIKGFHFTDETLPLTWHLIRNIIVKDTYYVVTKRCICIVNKMPIGQNLFQVITEIMYALFQGHAPTVRSASMTDITAMDRGRCSSIMPVYQHVNPICTNDNHTTADICSREAVMIYIYIYIYKKHTSLSIYIYIYGHTIHRDQLGNVYHVHNRVYKSNYQVHFLEDCINVCHHYWCWWMRSR